MLFETQCAPLLVSATLYLFRAESSTQSSDESFAEKQLDGVFLCNGISTFCCTTLIFVHWKKGSYCWRKFAPWYFLVLTLTLYLIVPLSNLLSGLYIGVSPKYDLLRNENMPYLLFYYVTCTSRLVDFFTFIRPKPLKDAILHRKYMAEQERMLDIAAMDAMENET